MTAGPGLDALTAIDVHVHAEVSTGQPPVPHEDMAEGGWPDDHPGPSLVPLAG